MLMKIKLTCPVCDRPEIEDNICPNCETNLSLFRMLAELPVATEAVESAKRQRQNTTPWLPISIGIVLLILGIGLGASGNYLLSRQKPIAQTSTPTANATSIKTSSKPELLAQEKTTCNGFYYIVLRGDSLSLIASRFYGDEAAWSFITEANPKIKGRENSLEIGEKLLIPNREESCP